VDDITQYITPLYYDYASNDCPLLEQKSKYGQFYARTHYGAECRSDVRDVINGRFLDGTALGVGLPDGMVFPENTSRLITYLHIIRHAVSQNDGDVLHENVKIVPQKCERRLSRSCPVMAGMPVYDEVFTMTQSWGRGFYHGMLEDLPRLAPYLPFLLRHPEIKIHVVGGNKYLRVLGIPHNRLLTANAVVARVLYMPAGGTCGRSALFTTQVLSQTLLHAVHNRTRSPQDTIVLIKRSSKRWFQNHAAILKMLQKRAAEINLRVEVFDDKSLPDVPSTIKMFHRAMFVVAPHGAGESNVVFSQPGTVIIEGLCYDSDKMANLCYRNLAQALGMRYHGLIYHKQCMTITAEQIEQALLQYITLL
jgi:hypothetical protein